MERVPQTESNAIRSLKYFFFINPLIKTEFRYLVFLYATPVPVNNPLIFNRLGVSFLCSALGHHVTEMCNVTFLEVLSRDKLRQ